jgi:outer membrane lipoprotein SlyB
MRIAMQRSSMMNKVTRSFVGVSILSLVLAVPALSKQTSFSAHLSGRSEVPARDTQASGEARFDLAPDASTLQFRVTTGTIENVTAVQLFAGAATENGTAIATLYGPMAPGGGKKSGVLATGALAATNLTGTFAGKTIADLVTEMQAGHIYVNVLTDDGQNAPDQKPGDFASGEIRGQIR